MAAVSVVASRRHLISFVLLSVVIFQPTTRPSSSRIRRATPVLLGYFPAFPSPVRSTGYGTSKFVRGLADTAGSSSVGLQTFCWLAVAASLPGVSLAMQKLALLVVVGNGITNLSRGEVRP